MARRTSNGSERLGAFLVGAMVGVGLALFLDPVSGRRRRAQLRNKGLRLRHDFTDWLGRSRRDFVHRGTGLLAELRAAFRHESAPDRVIGERVRAKLGRLVSHPTLISTTVSNRRVTLSGSVLEREAAPLAASIRAVRGVQALDNRLAVYATEEELPGVAGSPPEKKPPEPTVH